MSMNLGLRRAATILGIAACSALALSSCGMFQRAEPSRVAQGRYFASGHPAYDEFFLKLYHAQLDMAGAPDLRRREQAALSRELALNPEVSSEQLTERLKMLAAELAHNGTFLKLDVPARPASPQDSVTLRVGAAPEAEKLARFRTQVERSATALFQERESMRARRALMDRLKAQSFELEATLDRAFQPEGPAQAALVRKNLDDAQKMMALIAARADEIANDADQLLAKLSHALNTERNPTGDAHATNSGTSEPKAPRRESPSKGSEPVANSVAKVPAPPKATKVPSKPALVRVKAQDIEP